jgi:hypothetical protein
VREAIASSFCNVIIFAVWVGVPTIAPEADEFLPRAFGNRPFGFPVQRVVFWVMCVLYLPVIPAVCGLIRLAFIRAEMVKAAGHQEWERVEWLGGLQRPARRLAWFGLAYFVVLAAGWIAWTAAHGL